MRMRDPARIPDIMNKLTILWRKHPDARLGQLVENLFGCEKQTDICISHMEDDVAERIIDKAIEKGFG